MLRPTRLVSVVEGSTDFQEAKEAFMSYFPIPSRAKLEVVGVMLVHNDLLQQQHDLTHKV